MSFLSTALPVLNWTPAPVEQKNASVAVYNVSLLPRCGKTTVEKLAKVGILSVADLLQHYRQGGGTKPAGLDITLSAWQDLVRHAEEREQMLSVMMPVPGTGVVSSGVSLYVTYDHSWYGSVGFVVPVRCTRSKKVKGSWPLQLQQVQLFAVAWSVVQQQWVVYTSRVKRKTGLTVYRWYTLWSLISLQRLCGAWYGWALGRPLWRLRPGGIWYHVSHIAMERMIVHTEPQLPLLGEDLKRVTPRLVSGDSPLKTLSTAMLANEQRRWLYYIDQVNR